MSYKEAVYLLLNCGGFMAVTYSEQRRYSVCAKKIRSDTGQKLLHSLNLVETSRSKDSYGNLIIFYRVGVNFDNHD